MSRKPVVRVLPRLAAVHPHFGGFAPQQTAVHELVKLLRTTVERVREDQPKHFYSQREVARFFGVPQCTAHLAYRQLGAEGLLTNLRGSGTLVMGRRLQPRVPPRGVVGLPIWTEGFARLHYWRVFLICLEEALRHENFVADTVHFRGGDESRPDFAERLLAHHLDYCIWLYPLPRSRPVIERLADGGVRTVALVEKILPSHSFRQYHVVRTRALTRALQAWQRQGIKEVIVLGSAPALAAGSVSMQQALARSGMRHTFRLSLNPDRLRISREVGIIFDNDFTQLHMFREYPAGMLRLMHRMRVLVRNSVPLLQIPPEVRVDVVTAEWDQLARRLAREITSFSKTSGDQPVTIEAKWLPQVSARKFREEF